MEKSVIIDVRERDEFESEHIEGSINVPLSHFKSVAPGVLSHFESREILLMCRSGARAKLAKTEAISLGLVPEGGFSVYEGGILRWQAEGKPVIKKKKGRLPLLRQTHVAAGVLSLSGVVLGFIVDPNFFYLSGIVGAGLLFAGLSGICLMTNILAVMPWNRNIPELDKEVCTATTGATDC